MHDLDRELAAIGEPGAPDEHSPPSLWTHLAALAIGVAIGVAVG